MPTNVLVVEDETEIANLIEVYLTNEGFSVHRYSNGRDALKCIQTTAFDLALLDIMLPEIDGFTLCQRIRENYHYPVIMLTAKIEDIDKITGLTLGADDYITEPFNPLEMVARVKAQLRRYKRYNHTEANENIESANSEMYDFAGLYINRVIVYTIFIITLH